MRAGLAASGPELLLELFSASKRYGFVLQPTDSARAVTDAHVSLTACAGAATGPGGAPASGS